MSRTLFSILLVLPAVCALAAPALAAPDWERIGAEETVHVLTTDEDGEARETKIWVLQLDGQGYIRTGSTRWGDDVVRNPEIALRVGETDYPVRAEFIEDDAERERITAAFREKYGWTDAMLSWMRGSRPRIMQLRSR
jgi:hypothetical protein